MYPVPKILLGIFPEELFNHSSVFNFSRIRREETSSCLFLTQFRVLYTFREINYERKVEIKNIGGAAKNGGTMGPRGAGVGGLRKAKINISTRLPVFPLNGKLSAGNPSRRDRLKLESGCQHFESEKSAFESEFWLLLYREKAFKVLVRN